MVRDRASVYIPNLIVPRGNYSYVFKLGLPTDHAVESLPPLYDGRLAYGEDVDGVTRAFLTDLLQQVVELGRLTQPVLQLALWSHVVRLTS